MYGLPSEDTPKERLDFTFLEEHGFGVVEGKEAVKKKIEEIECT